VIHTQIQAIPLFPEAAKTSARKPHAAFDRVITLGRVNSRNCFRASFSAIRAAASVEPGDGAEDVGSEAFLRGVPDGEDERPTGLFFVEGICLRRRQEDSHTEYWTGNKMLWVNVALLQALRFS
jgi:hypothetical protein